VARQTRERAAEIGLALHELPEWYDVDDLASLQMLHDELFDRRAYAQSLAPHAATHSAALLDDLLARTDLAQRLDRADARAATRAIA
jgi:hypothetical protein